MITGRVQAFSDKANLLSISLFHVMLEIGRLFLSEDEAQGEGKGRQERR